MLKVITLKFEERLEGFNDSMLSEMLAAKEIIRWESRFFERKDGQYWTVIVEYEPLVAPVKEAASGAVSESSGGKKADADYRKILAEKDWPLFKKLREWRGETAKKEGVPPYIIFNNTQLARVAVSRPASLNALQEIDGIGEAKRSKYGPEILAITGTFAPEAGKDAGTGTAQ